MSNEYSGHPSAIFLSSLEPSDYFIYLFFAFIRQHLHHMEASRLGAESELQLPVYTTAVATWDPSHICNLHYSSQQRQILNPLSEAKDPICNLMVPSRIHFCCTTTRTAEPPNYKFAGTFFFSSKTTKSWLFQDLSSAFLTKQGQSFPNFSLLLERFTFYYRDALFILLVRCSLSLIIHHFPQKNVLLRSGR